MRQPVAVSERVESVLNEIAADQAVFRFTLQCFLLRMFDARPEVAPQALADMNAQVLPSISRIPASDEDRQGALRWKRLASDRAEELFLELEDALGPDAPARKRRAAD